MENSLNLSLSRCDFIIVMYLLDVIFINIIYKYLSIFIHLNSLHFLIIYMCLILFMQLIWILLHIEQFLVF